MSKKNFSNKGQCYFYLGKRSTRLLLLNTFPGFFKFSDFDHEKVEILESLYWVKVGLKVIVSTSMLVAVV